MSNLATSISRVDLNRPLLDASAAAELLAVKRSWIYEAVRGGQLPCLKIGRHIRFTQHMLEEWLSRQVP